MCGALAPANSVVSVVSFGSDDVELIAALSEAATKYRMAPPAFDPMALKGEH
jgi:hypothetical protein